MIRKYAPKDLNALLDAWYNASHIAHHFLDEAFFQKERKNIPEVYLPVAETYVYESDGTVVGFIALIENEVGAIFVDPESQGKGVGRKLMDHARELRGTLDVDVFKANIIGRRFYDRYGFKFVTEHLHEETQQPLLRLKLTP